MKSENIYNDEMPVSAMKNMVCSPQAAGNSAGNERVEHENAGVAVVEKVRPRIRKPRLFRVVMLNDDYTPMDFVVHVLEDFFQMNREQATRTMLKVHVEGRAICGVFTRDIAETKSEQINQYSLENEHPLLCQIEPDSQDSDE